MKALMYRPFAIVYLNYSESTLAVPVDSYSNWYSKMERYTKGFSLFLPEGFNLVQKLEVLSVVFCADDTETPFLQRFHTAKKWHGSTSDYTFDQSFKPQRSYTRAVGQLAPESEYYPILNMPNSNAIILTSSL